MSVDQAASHTFFSENYILFHSMLFRTQCSYRKPMNVPPKSNIANPRPSSCRIRSVRLWSGRSYGIWTTPSGNEFISSTWKTVCATLEEARFMSGYMKLASPADARTVVHVKLMSSLPEATTQIPNARK